MYELSKSDIAPMINYSMATVMFELAETVADDINEWYEDGAQEDDLHPRIDNAVPIYTATVYDMHKAMHFAGILSDEAPGGDDGDPVRRMTVDIYYTLSDIYHQAAHLIAENNDDEEEE